ncbi:uroporphyrinogen-III synthase, partial [Xanthomonas oryzae pv. oryzae]
MTGLAHPDAAWTLISLRPSGEHAPLRRAVARHGGRVLALSPWRLQ